MSEGWFFFVYRVLFQGCVCVVFMPVEYHCALVTLAVLGCDAYFAALWMFLVLFAGGLYHEGLSTFLVRSASWTLPVQFKRTAELPHRYYCTCLQVLSGEATQCRLLIGSLFAGQHASFCAAA